MAESPERSRLDAISTRWSLLVRSREGTMASAAEARSALVLRYAPAIRNYVAAIVRDRDDAEDLAQDIFVRLMAGDFAGADPARGRFRDFLKVSLRNMVRNFWSKSKRRQTVPLTPDETLADGAAADDPWVHAWRQRVLDLAWSALREKERSRAGSTLCTVLRLRADFPEETSDELARRLSEKVGKTMSPPSLRQQLRRARLQFADLVIDELSRGIDDPTPTKIQEELQSLGLLDYILGLLPPDGPKK